MILIVGHRPDPHVESVAQYLSGCGLPFSIVDSFDSASDGLTASFGKNGVLDLDGCQSLLSDVKSVWWRQKPRFVIPSDSVESLYDYYFVHREWNHVIDYLAMELERALNINKRSSALIAGNKIRQLDLAEKAGFLIPRTLLSNNFESIYRFIDGNDKKYVFKTFTPYMTPSGHMTYTTVVDKNLLSEKKHSIKSTPGIFQEFIEKEYELRITIVGDKIFAAKIASDFSPMTKVDWRQQIFEDSIYSVAYLQDELIARLLSLHRSLDLFYGAYDIVIGRDEEPYFLEVNPSGQWMWLEMKLGFPIGAEIGAALAQPLLGR